MQDSTADGIYRRDNGINGRDSVPGANLNAGTSRFTQGPDFAPALEVLPVDLHVVGALGLGDGDEFGDVLGASVAEPHGPRIVGLFELDL